MTALLTVGLIATIILILVGLYAILRVLEWMFPAFHRWLDEHVGEEPGRGRW